MAPSNRQQQVRTMTELKQKETAEFEKQQFRAAVVNTIVSFAYLGLGALVVVGFFTAITTLEVYFSG